MKSYELNINKINKDISTKNVEDSKSLEKDYMLSNKIEPFQQYILSDKSQYSKASETINPKTGRPSIDPHDYILVDTNRPEGHAFLLNISFKFINTDLFRKPALMYQKIGKYHNFAPNSLPAEKWRKREEYKRKNGVIERCKLLSNGKIVDLYITGEFYNFLNYGRVKVLDEEALKANIENMATKSYDFPKFIDFQFWYTTVKHFMRLNGFNNITLKARRKGASFMESIDSANDLNLIPSSIVIHAAGDKKYITKAGAITEMSYRQLIFYEKHTPFVRGAVNRYGQPKGLLSDTIEELTLGYKLKDGTRAGWGSILFSVSTKNEPGVAVGKDAVKIKCDELNDFPNFSDFMSVTNPTITTGAFKTGMISAFGTGGVKEGNWVEFEKNYYDTQRYDFMPFVNVWDENAEHETIGFFMPYWWGLQGVSKDGKWALDKDGNTDYETAIKISREEREDKKSIVGVTRDYIMFCSQYANRPSEAFNSGTETILTSLELKEHIKNVKLDTAYHFYMDGDIIETDTGLQFRSNDWLKSQSIKTHPYITKVPFSHNDDFAGCFRMYYRPFLVDGIVPDNLYFVTYDPVGSEIDKGEIKDRHSLASIIVWMVSNNIANTSGKIPVCFWTGRRDTHKEMDKIFLKVMEYYNARGLPEMDRGNVKVNFSAWNKLHKLLPDPTEVIINRSRKGNQRSYGMIIGTGARKIEGIDLFKDYLYEKVSVDEQGKILRRFHFIYDLPFLIEIDKFTFKGNFDRVSSALLAAYQFNLLTALKRKPKTLNKKKQRLQDLLLNT